jgi:hypothetical protein
MADIVGQIALELGVDTAAFTRQLRSLGKTTNSATNSILGSFGKIGGAVAGALSVGAIVNFSKACIELGSDLAEVQNVVDVTFGSMSGAVSEWAKNAMTSYGMSEKVAKEYMGQFGAMSKAFGNTEKMAYDQATALTGLAGDVASFYNMSTDEAFTKLKAVYTGETEALKSLGVVMTQTALDEYALQQGIGKTTKQMSEQEKVALRLSFVTDRLSSASGDFARTADGWANQTRVLTLRFDALKATIGQGLINALLPALQLLNDLVAKLQVFADAFYNLTVKVFGDAGGAGSAAAAASAALATNTENAAKSAAAYKKQLAGFDNLNVIGSSSGGGSTDGGGAGSGYTDVALPSAGSNAPGYDTSAIENTLIEIASVVGVASLALGAVLTFTGANIPLGIGLLALGAAGLTAAVALDANAANQQVTTGIDLITATVSAAALAVGAILCFSGVNIPLGISLLAVGAAGIVATTALNWESASNEIKTLIIGIETAVGAALLAMGIILLWAGMSIPLGIALIAAGAVSLVSAGVMSWGSVEGDVKDTVTNISAIVGGALLGLGAVLAFSGLFVGLGIALMAGGAVALASAALVSWDTLPEKTKNTISIVSAIAGGALLALGVILLCTGAGIPLGLGLIAAGGAALAAPIAANWGAITGKIKEICGKIGGFFSNLWDGIKKGFVSAVNGIIGFANKWIDGLNFLLTPIRALIVGIAKAFGNDISMGDVKIPHIPKLASGGYVAANTPQLAVIGDNKHEGEIVAPESKIAEAVATGFAMVMSKMQASNAGNDRPLYATIKIGEENFWEGFVDYHNGVVKRTGDSPLLV